MTNYARTVLIVHARLLNLKLPLAQYFVSQDQVRVTAPKSPAFTAPVAQSLTGWNTATDKVQSLYQQEQALTQQLAAVRQSRRMATEQMHLAELGFVNNVELAAQNDASVIQGLGLQVVPPRTSTAASLPAIPSGVVVTPGADPGGLHVTWPRAVGARGYQVQLSPEPVTATSWVTLAPQTRRTLKVGDLSSGAPYQVRVAAVNKLGASAYSTAARGVVR